MHNIMCSIQRAQASNVQRGMAFDMDSRTWLESGVACKSKMESKCKKVCKFAVKIQRKQRCLKLKQKLFENWVFLSWSILDTQTYLCEEVQVSQGKSETDGFLKLDSNLFSRIIRWQNSNKLQSKSSQWFAVMLPPGADTTNWCCQDQKLFQVFVEVRTHLLFFLVNAGVLSQSDVTTEIVTLGGEADTVLRAGNDHCRFNTAQNGKSVAWFARSPHWPFLLISHTAGEASSRKKHHHMHQPDVDSPDSPNCPKSRQILWNSWDGILTTAS